MKLCKHNSKLKLQLKEFYDWKSKKKFCLFKLLFVRVKKFNSVLV